MGDLVAQRPYKAVADSLERLLPGAHDTLKAKYLMAMGRSCLGSDDARAHAYFQQLEAVAERNQLELERGQSIFFQGITVHPSLGSALCLPYYERCLPIFEKEKALVWVGHTLLNLGSHHRLNSRYVKSLDYLMRALRNAEALNDSLLLCRTHQRIGYLYDRMSQHREAIAWHRRSVLLAEKLQLKAELADGLQGMGMAYDELSFPDSAIFFQEKALSIYRELDDSESIANVLANFGNTYNKVGRFPLALQLLQEAYAIFERLDDPKGLAHAGVNLGRTLSELGQLDRSEKMLHQALERAEVHNRGEFVAEANLRLSELYEKKGDHQRSLSFFKAYKTCSDSLLSKENFRQLAEIREIYEAEKKDRQLQITALELDTERARNRNHFMGGSALVMALVLATAYWINRQRFQQAEQLRTKEQLFQTQLLANSLQTQEAERKRIAGDLHDGLGQQLASLKFGLEQIGLEMQEGPLKKRLLALYEQIDHSSREVRALSHQMMPKALADLGLVPALEDMLARTFGNGPIACDLAIFGLQPEDRLPETIEIHIYRIAQELASNILKHSGATEVHFSLLLNGNVLQMVVEDNGKGLGDAAQPHGIGLENIRSRLSSIDGEWLVSPGPLNRGLEVRVRVNLPADAVR
jgi:signal transduction histidine kinase